MKKNNLQVTTIPGSNRQALLVATAERAHAAAAKSVTETFPATFGEGSIDYESEGDLLDDEPIQGEPDYDEGDPDVDLNVGDVEQILTGAVSLASQVRNRGRLSGKASPRSFRRVSGNLDAAILATKLPVFAPKSGLRVVALGTSLPVPGSALSLYVKRFATETPALGLAKTADGAGNTQVTTVTFSVTDLAGASKRHVPVIFARVISAALTSRPGTTYEAWIDAYTESGAKVSLDKTSFTRTSNNIMDWVMIPWQRLFDINLCSMITIAQDKPLILNVRGLDATEGLTVTLPGVNNVEYDKFLKTLRIASGF